MATSRCSPGWSAMSGSTATRCLACCRLTAGRSALPLKPVKAVPRDCRLRNTSRLPFWELKSRTKLMRSPDLNSRPRGLASPRQQE